MIKIIECKKWIIIPVLALLLLSCLAASNPDIQRDNNRQATATFAGGSFWCLEPPFEFLPGVGEVIAGYADGTDAAPSYAEVASGDTDFTEAVQVYYNPERVSYETLLETYWLQIDPTDATGQFSERGSQYRTAIFYRGSEQQRLAEQSKILLENSDQFKKVIVTEIKPFTVFYPAEEEHQDFYHKNPAAYKLYRDDSGRDKLLNQLWDVGDIWNIIKERVSNAKK